jgi:hypothetical protein
MMMSRARELLPKYTDKEIMDKLREAYPIFSKLVKFNYVNYKYQLLKYPKSVIKPYDIFTIAKNTGISEK